MKRAIVDHAKCPWSPGFVSSKVHKKLGREKQKEGMYVWQSPQVLPDNNYFLAAGIFWVDAVSAI